MMLTPDEVADAPASALPRDTSILVLQATLVEDQPEIPVYDAVQIVEQTRLKKNKKIIIALGMGLLIGTVVTAGVSVRSNSGSSDGNITVSEVVVVSTALPSESLSPSQLPSIRPTLRPSQSTKPSQYPSRSLRPSISPSNSTSPTPFCFGVEINILTDDWPQEISWTISRTDNVDGVANSKFVVEGSPEKEKYHTSDEVCLERGDYEFAIFDSHGDGISSPGYYNLAFEGMVIAQGGKFESEEKVYFSLPLPSPQPSESSSSSPSKFPSASFQPSESMIPSQSLSPSLQPSNSFSPSTYWSSLKWNRQGLSLGGDTSGDFFGKAVAISADASTMAVGAPGDQEENDRPGYVKVYRREEEGSGWEQRGETIYGEANGDGFGHSLSLSDDGTTLSIGAPGHDFIRTDSGQVKVYKWDEATLSYAQIGDSLYGAVSGDQFGWSLDISKGTTLAVGAIESDVNGRHSGQVTVYVWDDASTNFKQRGQAIDGDATGDYFGTSVSLAENGQKLAVGAPWNGSNGYGAGQVKVFKWDEATSNHIQLGDSLLGEAGDWFGQSVSFSSDGTTLAVAAPNNGVNSEESGHVKVFALDAAASNFKQIGQSLYGKEANDHFGYLSLALSATGRTLAIGARQSYDKPGYVEVYGWDEAAREYKLLGKRLGGKAPGDWFGYLALTGNGRVLAVGAPENDENGTDSGRVEVFDMNMT